MGGFIKGFLEDDTLEAVQRLKPIADDAGLSMPQLALAWILREDNVASAIIGASRPGAGRGQRGRLGGQADSRSARRHRRGAGRRDHRRTLMEAATAPAGVRGSPRCGGALAGDLLERFQRYVRVDTQSARDRTQSPSTSGQLDLAGMLVDELHEIGVGDAQLDENGYVTATLPSTVGADAPVVGLIAHVDTSPDESGAGVEPIVHRGYDGGVIELPQRGTRLDPERMPELAAAVGHDVVTSSGDTLLGADDKAGVAEIMTAVAHLSAHPELPRPTLRVCFTPDEEVGQGAELFDVERFGAACAYTLDGSTRGEIQDETFTAAEAVITVEGVDVHPGFATGKLINALRLAARIVAALPADTLTPETYPGGVRLHPPVRVLGLGRPCRDPRDRARLRRRQAVGRARGTRAEHRPAGGGG